MRLHNQSEYAAPSIILNAAKKATVVLLSKAPISVRNSPTKLLVPGKPRLAIEKNKKQRLNKGITCVKPV